jgi:hypothetical protein
MTKASRTTGPAPSAASASSNAARAPGHGSRTAGMSATAAAPASTDDEGPDPTAGLLQPFALPAPLRERFEGSLGVNLGDVRLHANDASAEAAAAMGARAFAQGSEIHFAAGQYRPDDPFGQHLIAHEVAHTVQQAAGMAPVGIYRSPMPANEGEPTKEEKAAAFAAEKATSAPKVSALRRTYDEAFAKAAAPTGDFSALDGPHEKKATKKTPLDDIEGQQAFIKAWVKAFGKPIPRPVLALLVGQWKAEGGNTGITNNNVGNLTVPVTPGMNPSSDYTVNKRKEFTAKGEEVELTQNFASFDSPTKGAMALIKHVMKERGALWMALQSGKVEDYAYVLKSYGYYTGPVEDVRAKGKLLSYGYLTNMKANMPSFEPEPTFEGGSMGIKAPPAEKTLPEPQ